MAKNILENELFESFANASDNIYIYVCDMQKDLSRWSKNTVDYFGLEGEYIEGAGPKWMEHIHPDDRAAYLQDINAVFSGASSRHSCQYRAKNKYGDYVWLECKGSVISDENGKPLFFAGLMTRLDNQNKYDPLTHLLTSYEMQKYDFSAGSGAILLLGINGFRKINNTNGFLYGNKVLVALSECLEKLADKDNRVYRLQGNEFMILSPNGRLAGILKTSLQIFPQMSAAKPHDLPPPINVWSVPDNVSRQPEPYPVPHPHKPNRQYPTKYLHPPYGACSPHPP